MDFISIASYCRAANAAHSSLAKLEKALESAQSPTPPPSPVALVEAARWAVETWDAHPLNVIPADSPIHKALKKFLAHLGETGRKG